MNIPYAKTETFTISLDGRHIAKFVKAEWEAKGYRVDWRETEDYIKVSYTETNCISDFTLEGNE